MQSSIRSSSDFRFEALAEKVRPASRSILARFRIPPEDAQDLVQDTFLLYFRRQGEVMDPERWFLGTLRMRCRMYWRVRRRSLYQAIDEELLEALQDPRSGGEQSRTRDAVRAAIAGVSARCQALLKTRYELGCDGAETAARLGYKQNGIYKVLERCVAALSARLAAGGLDEHDRGAGRGGVHGDG